MLKIAICDDSAFMREITKNSLVKYSVQNNIEIQIYEYETGELLLETEKTGTQEHNLIFMDYDFENKGNNGLAIISELRKQKKNTAVIFLSSYSQVVFQSFEVNAFRFLVKPLEEKQLFEAMDDFLKSVEEDSVLSIRIDGEHYLIKEEMITYVEGFGKNCILHFADGRKSEVINEPLSVVEGRLSRHNFFRCQKSYLIHLRFVNSYNHTSVTMESGEVIQLSRNKYREFGTALGEYISRRRGI